MTTVSKPNPALPTFEARDIGGTWDITMRIPHKAYGGDTIEQILIITENGGAAPAEETIARRVCALLNMSAHIDTEDLFIKGATLTLGTFSENSSLRDHPRQGQAIDNALHTLKQRIFGDAVTDTVTMLNAAITCIDNLTIQRDSAQAELKASQKKFDDLKASGSRYMESAERVISAEARKHTVDPGVQAVAEMTDREKDLQDTCRALRNALSTIGRKFGVSSGDAELVAKAVVDEHTALQAKFSQADHALNEHSEAISQLREHFMIPTSSGPVAAVMAVKVKADESAKIIHEHTKLINELRSITGTLHASPSGLLVHVRNFKENADLLTERTNALADATVELADCKTILHDIRTSLEVDPDYEYGDLPAITAELFDNLRQSREANKETAGQLAKADQELATARGERDTAYCTLKDIQRVLGVVVENPKELPGIVTKLANDLTSVRSAQTTLDPFKREVMALCMMEQSSPAMLPSLPELLIGIREYVNTLTRYRGGAMILHDLACQLTGMEFKATDAEPYANIPWQVLADRLEEKFNAPRNAIATLIGNYELEVKDDWRDNVTELYTFIKGLSVAQFKHDEQLQTLLAERSIDRSIIGAIDDLLGDTSRPAAPLVAAVRALVRSHLIATERS